MLYHYEATLSHCAGKVRITNITFKDTFEFYKVLGTSPDKVFIKHYTYNLKGEEKRLFQIVIRHKYRISVWI